MRRAVAALLLLTLPSALAQPDSVPEGLTPALLAQLRAGGLVLYFRHFDTEGADASRVDLRDCSTQRNLSEPGRANAREVGQLLRELRIPIGTVLSGEYCRNRDSAALLTGWVTPTPTLNNPYFRTGTEADRQRVIANLRALLKVPPRAGTNTVIVTHEQNLRLTTGWMLAEGEAAVLKPAPDGSFRVMARVTRGGWAAALKPGR
ncbi:histidine phosphatase family protein [Deinococcus apachensis]|uniref:histidine phosphatase family protein n=1 Tax=Deinococcus apachensis TaxID=309886 RepID=UPI00037D59F4|nr:histidine phosphatase family protein [Deinococcus apachensis]